jgi:ATP-binding cassette, subfamily B, bacterial PglK
MFEQLKKLNFLIDRRQRFVLMVLTLLIFFGMILESFGLGIIIPAISVVLDPEFFFKSKELKFLSNYGEFSQTDFTLFFLGVVIFTYLLKTFFLIFLNYKQNKFLANLNASLMNDLFNKYLLLPYSFHLNSNSGVLLKNIQVEINYLNGFCNGLITLVVESFLIIAIVTTIIYIEPVGAISMALILGTSSSAFFYITKKKVSVYGNERQQMDTIISKYSLEGLSGIKDLKVFGRTKYFSDIFKEASFNRAIPTHKRNTLSQIPRYFLELMVVLGLVFFIAMMIHNQKSTSDIVTTLGVFVAASFRLLPSINRVIVSLQSIRFLKPSLDIIFNEMKLESLSNSAKHKNTLRFNNEICINNLSFKFSKELPNVLSNINLKIQKGKTIGFKGSSGCGKSTLVDLIIGLHYPSKGQINVDGQSIHDNIEDWQKKIGYVPQEIFLIDNNIINNIAFGIKKEDVDIKKVEQALKLAELNDFVNKLENGLKTNVGEHGVQLSGGQKQRLGLARALYHNPEILILDEATASLDTLTERNVMKSIFGMKGTKTILIVAHRLSTLDNCDVIYNINAGQVSSA